jgi:hypothetical protein
MKDGYPHTVLVKRWRPVATAIGVGVALDTTFGSRHGLKRRRGVGARVADELVHMRFPRLAGVYDWVIC